MMHTKTVFLAMSDRLADLWKDFIYKYIVNGLFSMNEHKILILLALLSFMCSGVVMAETHRIIPAVQEMQVGRGALLLNSSVTVSYVTELENEATLLAKYLDEDFNIHLEKSVNIEGVIDLCIDTLNSAT